MLLQLFEEANPFPKSKLKKVLYHGTYNPDLKSFDPDFDYDADNKYAMVRDYNLPTGVVYLSDDLNYTKAYGSRVLVVKVNANRILSFKVDGPPSIAFDDDYNHKHIMWDKFEDGGYDVLEIKGCDMNDNSRTTYITYPERCVVIDIT